MANIDDRKSKLSPAKQALLEQRLRAAANQGETTGSIPRRPAGNQVPLSFAQRRLWFLDQLQPGSSFYNVSRQVRVSGPLDYDALRAALNALVARHESLRTVFRVIGNEPVQIIQEPFEMPLPVLDLSADGHTDREKEAASSGLALAQASFNLAAGPLLAAKLIRLHASDHILFLALHHIITDAWSTSLLLRELAGSYEAIVAGEPPPLSRLQIQYADFALWQRELLKGETLERQITYWKQKLAGAPAMLELASDRPRPAVPTFRGAVEAFSLPASLTAALKDLSQRESATLFMTLLAAFQTLLWRHTRQDDIIVGAPIAGRPRPETESLIGFFVNTLVMRSRFSADLTFRKLLEQVKSTTLEAYGQQDLPFEKLVEELQPERSLSHNPLFQVTLSLQNVPQATGLGNFIVDPTGVDANTARLDLEAYFWELPEGLAGKLVYSTDLFDRSTIQRLSQRFQILLEGLVQNPDDRVSVLPLLPPEERAQLLPERKAGEIEPSASPGLHEIFERQVRQAPERIAVCFEDQRLSYGELNARANRLANYLIQRGAGPEKLIGLCVERSLELVVALLGILKSGAAYVPLDTAQPPERLSLIIEDAELDLIVTQKSLRGSAVETICLDEQIDELATASNKNPSVSIDCENPAYVIYTSGSTGKPKGVVVTHRNVVRLLETTTSFFDFGPDDVWTLFHSYAFDFSVWELWGALCYGGRLIVVPYLISRAPEDLYELLCAEQVTVLNQTPSAFRQLIKAESEFAADDRLSLREVIFGGEALDFQSLRPWFARHGDSHPRLVNMYGITETTVHVTCRPLQAADSEMASASLLGRPLNDLRVYILDRQQQLAPTGVPGEIYVGGAGVARGYLNRADLTAERFVPDPFAAEPGSRLYRSGDLARYTASHDIEYLGRVDRQVKVRGFRIELGEIDSVLSQHETVRECLVLAGEAGEARNDQQVQQLVAYVIRQPDRYASAEELRNFLKRRLPPYMVPASFVFIDHFPLTANGKIDVRALPAPDKSSADLERQAVAPRNDTEEQLARLWTDVLGRAGIGVHDNFFDLGGHSLLATQLLSRIRDTFKVNLALRYFFERPTIAGLAEFLRDADSEKQAAAPAIRRLPRE